MDQSLNKTRFQGVKLIFDSENKQFFPKKHVQKSKNCDFSSKNVINVQIVLFSFEKCWNLNVKNVKNILKLFSNFS